MSEHHDLDSVLGVASTGEPDELEDAAKPSVQK